MTSLSVLKTDQPVQCSVAEYPEAITYLLEQYDRVEAEEARLSDLITYFVDPNAEEDLAPTATHVGSELSGEDLDDDEDEDEEDGDDDSADDDNSIDPELAREKFAELRAQYVVTRDTIKAKGRSHAAAQEEILKLSEVFKQFRTVPKQFDYGQQHARHDGPRSYARTSDHEALR